MINREAWCNVTINQLFTYLDLEYIELQLTVLAIGR